MNLQLVPHQSLFLALPGELRNLIYHKYLAIGTEDGYIYNFETGKLRMSNMQPIDLNLMYTCRLAANEMRGLALRIHTITFTTAYSKKLNSVAGLWNHLFHERSLIRLLGYTSYMTDEMARDVAERYGDTHFYTVFCRKRAKCMPYRTRVDGVQNTFGEVPSVFRDMARDVLQLASTDPDIHDALMNDEHPNCRRHWNELLFFKLFAEVWKIPTAAEVDIISNQVAPCTCKNWKMSNWERDGFPRFSAAATAIRFLNANPKARKHIRKVVLREDHPSVAYPECHAQGLAPFCHENPALRIERRVSLWQNIFMSHLGSNYDNDIWTMFASGYNQPNMPADGITRGVAIWMAEAAIPKIPDAITLVLDGGPIPERTAHVFREVVQRDAAWQTALDRTFRLKAGASDHDDVFYKRGLRGFYFTGFPELLRDIVRVGDEVGSSIHPAGRLRGGGGFAAAAGRICCNFDPGRPWDGDLVAEIARTNGGHAAGLDAWLEAWMRDEGYQTVPPMPDFHLLFDSLVANADELSGNFWSCGENGAYGPSTRICDFGACWHLIPSVKSCRFLSSLFCDL